MSAPSPRPPRSGNSLLRALGIALAALVVYGCATPPPRPPIAEPAAPSPEPAARDGGRLLARDDDFAIVVAGLEDNLPSLAQRYLGDARKDWLIAEYNGVTAIQPGQTVVIPLVPRNRIGVHVDGFQAVPILCYHRFGNRPSKLTVTPAAFAAQMEYLAQNGYHVLTLAQVRDFLAGNEPVPMKSVVITIDDGYRSTYEIAYPILKKHGFPATVFLYSDFVGAGDALGYAQMRELATSGLIDVQPHSKTHSNLTLRLSGETDAAYHNRIRSEVDAPINVIHERLAVASVAYAYPYGDVNEAVVDLLVRKGVSLGMTVTPGGNGFFAYPYMLRRTMVFGNEDLDSFKAKLVTFVRTSGR